MHVSASAAAAAVASSEHTLASAQEELAQHDASAASERASLDAAESEVSALEREAAATRERFGLNVRVTAVPESFDHPSNELFDPAYMRALYDLGRERALAGEAWSSVEEADAEQGPAPVAPAAAIGG